MKIFYCLISFRRTFRINTNPRLVAMTPIKLTPFKLLSLFTYYMNGFGKPLSRAPNSDPSLAKLCSSNERGIRPTTNQYWDWAARLRFNERITHIEFLSGKTNRFTIK